MCLDTFLKAWMDNNRIPKSRAFHSVGAAYINDRSKNELAQHLTKHASYSYLASGYGGGMERSLHYPVVPSWICPWHHLSQMGFSLGDDLDGHWKQTCFINICKAKYNNISPSPIPNL